MQPWKAKKVPTWHYHSLEKGVLVGEDNAYRKVLCIRDVSRVVGHRDQSTGKFISFLELSVREKKGEFINSQPVTEQRCIFSLDTWHGPDMPWLHVGSGGYRGFYRIPPIKRDVWNGHEIDRPDIFALVALEQPSTFEGEQGEFSVELPGIYLAQSEMQGNFINWSIHHSGYKFRSNDRFSVMPRDALVMGISVRWWIELPDPGLAVSPP